MAQIVLDGKEYKLELEYDAVEYLEEHYDLSIINIFQTVDITRQKNLRTIYKALLMNEEPGITDEKIKELFKKAIKKEEVEFMGLVETVSKVFEESLFFRKAMAEGKKQQSQQNLKSLNA